MAHDITVGLRAPYDAPGGAEALARFAVRVDATSIGRVCAGDHVTFKGGRGFDGLVNATALAVMSRRVTVQTAVYLLPLRHPVPVARQVSSLAALAPGRLECSMALLCDFVFASSAVTRSPANSRAAHRSSRDRDQVTEASRHRTFENSLYNLSINESADREERHR